MSKKVNEWKEEIEKLAIVAGSQPHAAYAAYTHGTKHKWTYICRTEPNCSRLLQPLEDAIQLRLIPAISGRPPSSTVERELLALPTKMGGLGLSNPTVNADFEFNASKKVTAPLVQLTMKQSRAFKSDPTQSNPLVREVKRRRLSRWKLSPRDYTILWMFP